MRIGKWKSDEGRTSPFLLAAAAAAGLLALGAVIMAALGAFGCIDMDKRSYPEGTTVNGVPIGGMTKAEARRALDGEISNFIENYSVTLRFGDGEDIVLAAGDLRVKTDADEVLDRAARGGSYELGCAFSDVSLKKCLEKTADKVMREPTSGKLKFDKSRFPTGARFSVDEGTDGAELDVAACMELIKRGEKEINAPMRELKSGSAAENELPSLIAAYETSFAGNGLNAENRVFNIKKAAELVNGSVVEPFSIISMNDKLGERTAENGWRDAPGITELGAGTEDQPGGGVCQVSTTVFNAALLADMGVIERRAHSRMVSYAAGGRDATIDTNSFDLVLKNRSDSELFIFVWADENACVCRCEIYGKPLKRSVSVVSECVETVPPSEDEYVLDETLGDYEIIEENPAITGYRYNTYRIYYENGTEAERVLVAESVYYMHPRRLRAGRKYFS